MKYRMIRLTVLIMLGCPLLCGCSLIYLGVIAVGAAGVGVVVVAKKTIETTGNVAESTVEGVGNVLGGARNATRSAVKSAGGKTASASAAAVRVVSGKGELRATHTQKLSRPHPNRALRLADQRQPLM